MSLAQKLKRQMAGSRKRRWQMKLPNGWNGKNLFRRQNWQIKHASKMSKANTNNAAEHQSEDEIDQQIEMRDGVGSFEHVSKKILLNSDYPHMSGDQASDECTDKNDVPTIYSNKKPKQGSRKTFAS